MASIFDTPKGKHIYPIRTICEVHREIYDLAVIFLHERPQELEQMKRLLEEAFIMGIRMNNKLIEHKLKTSDIFKRNDQNGPNRAERERLVKILAENKELIQQKADNDRT